MRYVYNTDKSRFEPYEFDLGSTNRKLQGWSNGVSTEEARSRVALLGANVIKVDVPSLPVAILQEYVTLLLPLKLFFFINPTIDFLPSYTSIK